MQSANRVFTGSNTAFGGFMADNAKFSLITFLQHFNSKSHPVIWSEIGASIGRSFPVTGLTAS